jgi:Protein kinase domain
MQGSMTGGTPSSMTGGMQGVPPGAYAGSAAGSFVNTRYSNTMSSAGHQTKNVNRVQYTMMTAISTISAPDLRGQLENALDNMAQSQVPFLGRYVMLSAAHRRQGGQGVVQFARGVHDGEEYAIKFFTHRPAFFCEFELYQNPVLRSMMPAVTEIDANENGQTVSKSGWPIPPCIVIERGESLDMWAKRINPDFTTILQVLTHVCTRLQLLHDNGLAHRDLKPGNILWRPKHLQWTLIDFGCAAALGALLSMSLAAS